MKKTIVMILSLVMVLALSVCAFAAPTDFDPTLDIDTSADGKTITVTMNGLPDGVAAELTIPCDGWSSATVKDSSGKVVKSTFGKTDANPDPDVEQMVNAVTFDAVGGTYTITKGVAYYGGYYPTTSDKLVESADTYDAGVVFHVVVTVLGVTGSAWLLKKED